MAQVILTKNGTGSAYPTVLSQGELALNVHNGLFFYGTSGSANVVSSSFAMHNLNLIKSGSTQGHITASGNISSSNEIQADTFVVNGVSSLDHSGANAQLRLGYNTAHTKISLGRSGTTTQVPIEGHITASGNISSSGNVHAQDYYSNGVKIIDFDGQRIRIGNQALDITGNITASGHISMSNQSYTFQGNRKLRKTSATTSPADVDGDIVYFGSCDVGSNAGAIYHYVGGDWALADADAVATSKGLLGVALDRFAPSVSGMLVRGMVTLANDYGSDGDILYLGTEVGQAQNTAPTGDGDVVRVIGYCLDDSNKQVYFNPDNTFIEITA